MEEYEEHFGEFSNYGRSSRVPPGTMPVVATLVLFVAAVILALLLIATSVAAQSVSGAASQSASSNNNVNASVSSVNIGGPAATTKETVRYQGSYRVESAPSVSAPAIFGGGHPCLAGKSGGVSIVGGGFSYGQGDPEPACMAWIMGQPEIALQIMAGSNPRFLSATCRVGFWRVGTAKVPVDCAELGVQTASTKARPAAKSAGNPVLLTKCELSEGKVRVSYTATGRKNKELANKQCLKRLGY